MKIYKGKNVFESTRTGVVQRTTDTTHFSGEPTGVGHNRDDGYLYFSDDSGTGKIHEVEPGGDCIFDVYDNVRTISVTDISNQIDDPEGVAYGEGKLFISDGVDKEVWVISLGADGRLGTNDDKLERHFDVEVHGMRDPEGIDYNDDSGTLILVSRREDFAIEVTISGDLVQTIDFTSANIMNPAGVTHAPRSNNANLRSLYIVDRAVDNGADPN